MRYIDQNDGGFNLFIVPVALCTALYIMWRRTHVIWDKQAAYQTPGRSAPAQSIDWL